jgi:hypothetical protein
MANDLTKVGSHDYVVNWSEHQKCFHIETIEEMFLRTRENFERGAAIDFVPIAFAASFKDADEIAETYRRKRKIPHLQDQLQAGGV